MSIYKGDKKIAGGINITDKVLNANSDNAVANMAVSPMLTFVAKRIQPGVIEELNQEAVVDATEFVNATGTANPVDLDLSSNGGLKKLTCAGTSQKPLIGLDSVRVSYNAPLDSTISPQIDVSNTDLSKDALTDMFYSMPYNVGYTVVGTPTIVDGVVSGFNASNYLQAVKLSNHIPFEYVVCFTPNTVVGTGNGIGIARIGEARFLINSRSHLQVMYSDGSNQWISESETTLVSNKKYWGKLTYDGTYIKLQISTNGENYTTGTTQEKNPRNNAANVHFGYLYDQFVEYDGSIDLNETYIKVNGVTWFNGAATRQLDPAATNVGNVTITNGIASGFTTSKYISTQATSSLPTSIKMATAFTANEAALARVLCSNGGSNNYVGIALTAGGTIRFGINDRTTQYFVNSSVQYEAGTKYYVIGERNDTELTISVSTDGKNWTTDTETIPTGAYSVSKTFYAGVYYSSSSTISAPFNGTIDLNNTSIEMAGSKIFSGMTPMIKTCSIVGCSGTVDLTQDEKDVVLNKGWALTVA